MSAIAAAIVAVVKALPAARDIYLRTVDLYFAEEERKDQNRSADIDEERSAIAAALKQPGMTDENRRILRKRLIALSKL